MKPKLDKVRAESQLAVYLTNHINNCGKSQKEIAREAGYPNPNNITMIKQGLSKLSIQKAPALAVALGIDPGELVMKVITEYHPGIYEALAETEVMPRNPLEVSLFSAVKKTLDQVKNPRKHAPDPALDRCVEEAIRNYFEPKLA